MFAIFCSKFGYRYLDNDEKKYSNYLAMNILMKLATWSISHVLF